MVLSTQSNDSFFEILYLKSNHKCRKFGGGCKSYAYHTSGVERIQKAIAKLADFNSLSRKFFPEKKLFMWIYNLLLGFGKINIS